MRFYRYLYVFSRAAWRGGGGAMAGVVAVAGAAQWRRGRGDGVVVGVCCQLK